MYKHDEQVRNLINKGISGSRRIAKELGISPVTTYKILKRLGFLSQKTNHLEPIIGHNTIQFTNNNIGEAAELYLRYKCELSNFPYCVPSRKQKYDLLVNFGDGFKRIQVKSSKHKHNGKYTFSLKCTRHNSTGTTRRTYSSTDIDYFFLYAQDGSTWLIPINLLDGHMGVIPEIRFKNYQI